MKMAVLQMLETWPSKDRLLSNSTPRFLTDDEESREQPSSVRPCSSLLTVEVLGLIINTSVFSEFSSKKLFVMQFFYMNYAVSVLAVQHHHQQQIYSAKTKYINIIMLPCLSLRVSCHLNTCMSGSVMLKVKV